MLADLDVEWLEVRRNCRDHCGSKGLMLRNKLVRKKGWLWLSVWPNYVVSMNPLTARDKLPIQTRSFISKFAAYGDEKKERERSIFSLFLRKVPSMESTSLHFTSPPKWQRRSLTNMILGRFFIRIAGRIFPHIFIACKNNNKLPAEKLRIYGTSPI